MVELIRHGASYANVERRGRGGGDGLHPGGRAQTERLRDRIGQVDEVYSSPLGRAMDVAWILSGRPPVAVPALGEVDLAGWNGDEWPEVEAAHLGEGNWRDGAGTGQGHAGETWSEVQRRVSPFLESLVRTHPRRRVAAVSHGGVIRACAGSVLDFGLEKARLLASLDNASVTQVVLGASGDAVLATYNITAHLDN